MTLFFVSGPFHIFNVVNLRLHEFNESDSDVCVLGFFEDAESFSEKLRNMGLFKNVYFIPKQQLLKWFKYYPDETNIFLKIIRYFKVVIRAIAMHIICYMPKHYINRFYDAPFWDSIYSTIVIPGYLAEISIYVNYMNKVMGSRVYMYDDGLGDRAQTQSSNKVLRYIIPTMFHYYPTHMVSGKFFYSPQLVYNKYRFPILKQVSPSKGLDKDIRCLSLVFNDDQVFYKSRIVYFHQGLDYYNKFSDTPLCEKDIIETLLLYRTKCGVAIKLHPSFLYNSLFESFDHACFVDHAMLPEFCYLKDDDISKKILISPFSAAVFNPIFIYGFKPYIVLTYKLLGIDTNTMLGRSEEEFEMIMDTMLRDPYGADSYKICIPETIEDMRAFIDNII